jgi:TRAP-type C4-dicarboxylate transport system substrate-binding protein
MKKIAFLICVILIAAMLGGVLTACGEAKPAKPVVLKFASAAMGPDYTGVEQAFVDAFNARCGPDYTIEYYGAEQMLSFPELLDGVRTGAADMAAITPNANSADEPKLGAVEMPFLFNNLDAHIYAVPKLMPLYADILEKQFNQKLLCLHNYTGMALISTKPVKTLEDWNGLLVQAISPVIASIIQALGGAPVTGQPYTESYSLLEKGTVDAVITAPAAMRIFALPDVAKYMASAYMSPAIHGFSINLDAWNKLPKNIQNIMLEEAQKQSDVIDNWLKGEWVKDHEAIAAAGVDIYNVPQAEIDRWKAACKPVTDELMATYGDFGKKVMDIANEANAKYPN